MKYSIFILLISMLMPSFALPQSRIDSLKKAVGLLDSIEQNPYYAKKIEKMIFQYTHGCRDSTLKRNKVLDKKLVQDLYEFTHYNREHKKYDSTENALFEALKKAMYPDSITEYLYKREGKLLFFSSYKECFAINSENNKLIHFEKKEVEDFTLLRSSDNPNFFFITRSFGHGAGESFWEKTIYRKEPDVIYPSMKILSTAMSWTVQRPLCKIDVGTYFDEYRLRLIYSFDYWIDDKLVLSDSFWVRLIWDKKAKILHFAKDRYSNSYTYDEITAKIVALSEHGDTSLFAYAFNQDLKQILSNPKESNDRKSLWTWYLLRVVVDDFRRNLNK